MGLRIHTNIPSITALRNLREADIAQRRSLERLSTGLRINRASDDPSGLVISEQLRAQIGSMKQALDNSQNASNLVATTEAALDEVQSLLVGIKESIVFALNSGGNDAEQIAAEQDAIDNALGSIDRIAQTTRFGTRKLLDGSAKLRTEALDAQISDINVQGAAFDGIASLDYTINVVSIASHAVLLSAADAYGGTQDADVTLRVTGSEGTQDITIHSAFTVAEFDDAVNQYTADTGVYASTGTLYSVGYGTSQVISLEVVAGDLDDSGLAAADGIQIDAGVDTVANVNGIVANADGYNLRVVSDVLTTDIRLSDGTDGHTAVAAGDAVAFTVRNEGLTFQLNQSAALSDREQLGIRSVHTSLLGFAAMTVNGIAGTSLTVGGYLSSLLAGGANDLVNDPKNGLRIVDSAISQISDLRAYLGAFQSNTVDTNIRSLSVAVENLISSESTIRDLDFAEETATFTRNQILYQSGIAVLAQSNLISQSVLTLLG